MNSWPLLSDQRLTSALSVHLFWAFMFFLSLVDTMCGSWDKRRGGGCHPPRVLSWPGTPSARGRNEWFVWMETLRRYLHIAFCFFLIWYSGSVWQHSMGLATKFRFRDKEVDQVKKTKAPLFWLFFLECIPKKEYVKAGDGSTRPYFYLAFGANA